jgi:hypothetical protein
MPTLSKCALLAACGQGKGGGCGYIRVRRFAILRKWMAQPW